MKVLAVVITDREVEVRCTAGLLAQDYSELAILTSVRKSPVRDTTGARAKYLNCSEHRNAARSMALASDADAFLFVDSDIVLPPSAVSSMVSRKKEIVGGWYPILGSDRWVAGGLVANGVISHALTPAPNLSEMHFIGCGCVLVTRDALERLTFESGVDELCRDTAGTVMMVGECGAFSDAARHLGYRLFMDGNVICEHINRNTK